MEAWRSQLERDKAGEGSEGTAGLQSQGASVLLSPPEEELFGSALSVEPNHGSRLAFLFIVREEFLLAPLWERFFKGQRGEDYSIYVYAASMDVVSSVPKVFKAASTTFWKVRAKGPHSRGQSATGNAKNMCSTGQVFLQASARAGVCAFCCIG